MKVEAILVPMDFSETSDAALDYAVGLAGTFGSTLHLLHVIPDPYTQPWAVEAQGFALADLLQQWEQGADAELRRRLPDTAKQPGQAELSTRVGNPQQEIVRYAREHSVDLIVMGTHGRGGVAHLLIGSVAERVVRRAPCPVLMVRHPGAAPTEGRS